MDPRKEGSMKAWLARLGTRRLAAVVLAGSGVIGGVAGAYALPPNGYYERYFSCQTGVLVGGKRLHCNGGYSSWGKTTACSDRTEWECP